MLNPIGLNSFSSNPHMSRKIPKLILIEVLDSDSDSDDDDEQHIYDPNKRLKASAPSLDDDILIDIFLRLPDYKSVIRCGGVCKQWLSVLSCREFFREFIRTRTPATPQPTTLLLQYSDSIVCRVFTDGGHSSTVKPYHGAATCASPLPNTVIRAVFHDLLLLSRVKHPHSYSIFNPATGQRVPFPDPPSYGGSGRSQSNRAMVTKGNRLRVVVFSQAKFVNHVSVFSSETKEWERTPLPHGPAPRSAGLVACGVSGTLHWMISWKDAIGVAVFNPFVSSGNPNRLLVYEAPPSSMPQWAVIGPVYGRLRLCQLLVDELGWAYLQVWELRDYHAAVDDPWRMVHDLAAAEALSHRHGDLEVLALHPWDGDVVFVLLKLEIWTYNIRRGTVVKLGQLPVDRFQHGLTRTALAYLRVFYLVHPARPTEIPALT